MTERKGELFNSIANPDLSKRSEQSPQDERIGRFVHVATVDALSRLPKEAGEQAEGKVRTALEKRLMPYFKEGEVLAEQLSSPDYKEFTSEISSFLQTRPGGVQCSDGRITNPAIFVPEVGVLHKRPQGLPETRTSTLDGSPVLDDQRIAASINKAIIRKIQKRENPEIVEFLGPHIDSVHPDHGCGAAAAKAAESGNPAAIAMKNGGIELYFDELGKGFEAFNTDIKRAGGKGATFDMVHDSHAQGLIFGLREAHMRGWMNKEKSLRDNLEFLHADGKIMMTELLDTDLEDDIFFSKRRIAEKGYHVPEQVDLKNPNEFAENMMLIGRLAKEITANREDADGDFSWIPAHLREGKSQNAIRTLAFTAIRNSVYRQLGGIEPGNHELTKHPEQLVRVGPIGAAHNVDNIAFVQVTPHGSLREQDEAGVAKLYGLAEKFMPQLKGDRKANFEQEGRIILVTGLSDEDKYVDEAKDEAFEGLASEVRMNAAKLRAKYAGPVSEGNAIVVSAIYSKDRKVMDVITSDPQADRARRKDRLK